MRKSRAKYSGEVLCEQLHALHDLLDQRRQIILKDPDFNPGNAALMDEMERLVKRLALIRDCFEEFCPS